MDPECEYLMFLSIGSSDPPINARNPLYSLAAEKMPILCNVGANRAQTRTLIREYNSTFYVGMVHGVSNSQYKHIGTKSLKAPKTAKTRLGWVKYKLFLH